MEALPSFQPGPIRTQRAVPRGPSISATPSQAGPSGHVQESRRPGPPILPVGSRVQAMSGTGVSACAGQ